HRVSAGDYHKCGFSVPVGYAYLSSGKISMKGCEIRKRFKITNSIISSCLDVEIWFIERKMYDYKT
ncbi:MAG: hypothetical protein WAZ30_12935, partial [Syntrophorhabdus sp.]